MDTTCEIPEGKKNSNGAVSDKLPTLNALKIADEVEILDSQDEKHTFKDIYRGSESPRRVLVVFVHHFSCSSCASYMKFICENATPKKLQEIDTGIVVIGHGYPDRIHRYRQDSGCTFPLYADPSERLYNALGMIKTWQEGEPHKYSPDSSISVAWWSIRTTFLGFVKRNLSLKSGTIQQQGGEFLFEGDGEDKTVKWCHRMGFAKDHTNGLLEVLGL